MTYRIPLRLLDDGPPRWPEADLERLVEASEAALGLWGAGPISRSDPRRSIGGDAPRAVDRHRLEVRDAEGRTLAVEIRVDRGGDMAGMWTGHARAEGLRWPGGEEGGQLSLSLQCNTSTLDCLVEGAPPPVVLELVERVGHAVGTPPGLSEVLYQAEHTILDGYDRRDRWRAPELASHLRAQGVELDADHRAQLLHRALTLGKPERVDAFLESGADPNRPVGDFEVRALHLAASRHDRPQIERLIAAGATLNGRDRLGRTPLHRAVTASRDRDATLATVDLLIDRGADVEAIAEGGDTPLVVALRSCRGPEGMAVLQRLMERGADPARCDDEGRDLIALATEWKRDVKALRALMDRLRGRA